MNWRMQNWWEKERNILSWHQSQRCDATSQYLHKGCGETQMLQRCFSSEPLVDISQMSAQRSLWLILVFQAVPGSHVPFSLTVLEDVIWLPGPPPIPPFSFVCVEFFRPDLFLPPSLCIEQPPTQSAQKRIVQLCHHYTSSQQGGDSAATLLHGWDVSPSEWWHFQMQQSLEVE